MKKLTIKYLLKQLILLIQKKVTELWKKYPWYRFIFKMIKYILTGVIFILTILSGSYLSLCFYLHDFYKAFEIFNNLKDIIFTNIIFYLASLLSDDSIIKGAFGSSSVEAHLNVEDARDTLNTYYIDYGPNDDNTRLYYYGLATLGILVIAGVTYYYYPQIYNLFHSFITSGHGDAPGNAPDGPGNAQDASSSSKTPDDVQGVSDNTITINFKPDVPITAPDSVAPLSPEGIDTAPKLNAEVSSIKSIDPWNKWPEGPGDGLTKADFDHFFRDPSSPSGSSGSSGSSTDTPLKSAKRLFKKFGK